MWGCADGKKNKIKNKKLSLIIKHECGHSVSLGTDPPLANQNSAIFSFAQTLKNFNKSPQADKKPW